MNGHSPADHHNGAANFGAGQRRRLVVAGGGYVGLATATGFARRGHNVEVIDVNPAVVQRLSRGELPFQEESLAQAFAEAVEDGRIAVRLGYAALDAADFVFICTPTPSLPDGCLDSAFVYDAAARLLEACRWPLRLVVRSTLNPGDTCALTDWVSARRPDAAVLFNPEFLREGKSLADFEAPSRVVIGGSDPAAMTALGELYGFAGARLILTDPTSAELIKVAANSALAVRVSMANEIAHLAGALGADCDAVLAGIGADVRIGSAYLSPGIGFGGSCLPKDLAGLRTSARRAGVQTPVFDGAQRTNEIAVDRIVEHVLSPSNGTSRGVAVIGAAFKSGSDSVRDSRAIVLIRRLLEEGIAVSVFDPRAEANARRELGDAARFTASVEEALAEASTAIVVDGTLLPGDGLLEADDVRLIDALGREMPSPAPRAQRAG